jgi:hypothetical protein
LVRRLANGERPQKFNGGARYAKLNSAIRWSDHALLISGFLIHYSIFSCAKARNGCIFDFGWAEGVAMRLRWLVVGLALLASPSAFAADCDDQTAIWTTAERDDVAHRLYHTGGVFFIEEWRKGRRAWRTVASWTSCSNGESTCTAFFEAQTGEVSATIEWIDDDGDGLAEWVVLAGLEQQFYYGGGATVEWDEGLAPKDYDGMPERAVPVANAYKFLQCRTEPIPLDKSSVFVAAASYND